MFLKWRNRKVKGKKLVARHERCLVKCVANWCPITSLNSTWICIEVCPVLLSFRQWNLIAPSCIADIRPYKCEVEDCNKYFVAPTHAKNHYTKVHINGVIRPYKCDVCGRGFNQKSSLQTHKTYHFDPQIPCPICGLFYRNKYTELQFQIFDNFFIFETFKF